MTKKIYIIHGWAYTIEKWEPFVNLLRKRGIDAVMLKVPGLTAPLNEVWDLNDYVEWLNKELAHEKDKVVLLGHSNGGRIGLAFCVKYPRKVKQLFLVDSAGIYHNELLLRIKRKLFGGIAKLGKKFTASLFLREMLYKLIGEKDYKEANPVLGKTLNNLIEYDLSGSLTDIAVPTIIIWGENDTITPLTDGKLMYKKIEKSELFIIGGARHAPQFTNVEEVGDIIFKKFKM